MKKEFLEEKKALKTALQNEINSRKLYLEQEKKAKTDISKKTFAYLAAQEFTHIEKIKKVDELLSKELDLDIEGEMKLNIDETKKLFKTQIKKWKEDLTDKKDFEPYEIAMEIERDGYNFYKESAEQTENRKIKRFFLYLMKEEASHFELLQNMHEYLKNPSGWNASNENWFFEG